MELGCHNPWGGPHHEAHRPQCEYLSVDRAAVKGVSSTHLVMGRGGGKTEAGLIFIAGCAFVTHVGLPLLWTEPRHEALFRVFLRGWAKLVPRELWTFNQARMQVKCTNGSTIDLVSRNVDNPSKLIGHGPNYAGAVNDELADKYNPRTWNDIKASVRHPAAPYRFMDSLSTPYPSPGYRELVQRPGATLIQGSSYDNPFLDRQTIDDYAADMDQDYKAVMILGQFQSFEGRVWTGFLDDEWPTGNRWTGGGFDPERPWWLGIDLGQGLGHWQIVQRREAIDRHGNRQYPGQVNVVVAEGLQHREAIQPVLARIADTYAVKYKPVMVAVGADVDTRGSTGDAPALCLTQRGWEYWKPTGELTQKSIQHQVLSRLLHNSIGERRWCVSSDLERHGPKDTWGGVENMFLNDTYPDAGKKEWFRKDKASAGVLNIEDARDSSLYLSTFLAPPIWAVHDRFAAA